MKIIQILPELNAGGIERGTLELAAHLVREGHQVTVISNGGRMVKALEDAGASHVAMPVHRKSVTTLLQVPRLRKLLVELDADILHLRARVPGWVAWLAWRGMNRQTRPRLVSTVNGFYTANTFSAVMNRAERVIAVSAGIRDDLVAKYPSIRANQIRVIPRGIREGNFDSGFQPDAEWLDGWHEDFPGLRGKEVLLLPGRITRFKGHDEFFHLIAALRSEGRQVMGLVVGETHPKNRGFMQELQQRARDLCVTDFIHFLGHRPDLREIMAVSDVICSLSQRRESFGRTAMEALSLGKPVAGYDCGGVGELLDKLFPAGKVPRGDASRLIGAVRAILIGRPAPLPIGEIFSREADWQSTFEVYEELAAAPR